MDYVVWTGVRFSAPPPLNIYRLNYRNTSSDGIFLFKINMKRMIVLLPFLLIVSIFFGNFNQEFTNFLEQISTQTSCIGSDTERHYTSLNCTTSICLATPTVSCDNKHKHQRKQRSTQSCERLDLFPLLRQASHCVTMCSIILKGAATWQAQL